MAIIKIALSICFLALEINSDCNYLEPPTNGFSKLVASSIDNTQMHIECTSGYVLHLNGQPYTLTSIEIDCNNITENQTITCESIECPELENIPNAVRQSSSLKMNAVIEFICDQGYFGKSFDGRLVRRFFKICLPDGTWLDAYKVSGCTKVECEQLKPPANVTVTPDNQTYSFGDGVTLSCTTGFWFRDSTLTLNSVCNSDSTWSLSSIPPCIPIPSSETTLKSPADPGTTQDFSQRTNLAETTCIENLMLVLNVTTNDMSNSKGNGTTMPTEVELPNNGSGKMSTTLALQNISSDIEQFSIPHSVADEQPIAISKANGLNGSKQPSHDSNLFSNSTLRTIIEAQEMNFDPNNTTPSEREDTVSATVGSSLVASTNLLVSSAPSNKYQGGSVPKLTSLLKTQGTEKAQNFSIGNNTPVTKNILEGQSVLNKTHDAVITIDKINMELSLTMLESDTTESVSSIRSDSGVITYYPSKMQPAFRNITHVKNTEDRANLTSSALSPSELFIATISGSNGSEKNKNGVSNMKYIPETKIQTPIGYDRSTAQKSDESTKVTRETGNPGSFYKDYKKSVQESTLPPNLINHHTTNFTVTEAKSVQRAPAASMEYSEVKTVITTINGEATTILIGKGIVTQPNSEIPNREEESKKRNSTKNALILAGSIILICFVLSLLTFYLIKKSKNSKVKPEDAEMQQITANEVESKEGIKHPPTIFYSYSEVAAPSDKTAVKPSQATALLKGYSSPVKAIGKEDSDKQANTNANNNRWCIRPELMNLNNHGEMENNAIVIKSFSSHGNDISASSVQSTDKSKGKAGHPSTQSSEKELAKKDDFRFSKRLKRTIRKIFSGNRVNPAHSTHSSDFTKPQGLTSIFKPPKGKVSFFGNAGKSGQQTTVIRIKEAKIKKVKFYDQPVVFHFKYYPK